MGNDKKNISIDTKVKQKIATDTKLALALIVVSSVLVLGLLAKAISYEFYILSQKEYTEILSSNVIGYVRDAETGEPIVGVEISFDEYVTKSDEKGFYKLALPREGKYRVRVSGDTVGYYNQIRDQLPIASLPYVHHIYLRK